MPGWILRRELTDGTPVYSIGYRVNGRTVKRKVGHTRREAEAALIIALADVEKGVIRQHTTDRIDAYSARWLERRAPFVEPGTIQAYQNDFTYRINPTLGDVRLRDLTAERIEAAIRDMQELKPRRGSPNPGGAGTRRMRIREEYREMHYLMPEEIPLFLEACDPEYADLAAVLALAGLRVSEALALEPRDIDPRAGMIRVARSVRIGTRSHLKDKTPRGVEIGPRLAQILARRIVWCQAEGHRICFPDPDDGDYIDRTVIRSRWHRPALIDAGLAPRLRVHDLRHTAAAAWLIAGGQSLEYVRRQLGHASIRETQKYAHLERAGRSQAADITEAGTWTTSTPNSSLSS